MACVNEYCRRRRAHRFTRKELHRIKHLPWVRAGLTHVQTPHSFICSIRASCVVVLTVVCGWWQDSLHQRVISTKGRVHTLDGDMQNMAWKETAGKVFSAKTIQRQAVKKKKKGWKRRPKVQIFFPHECSCSPVCRLQFCTSFCSAVP